MRRFIAIILTSFLIIGVTFAQKNTSPVLPSLAPMLKSVMPAIVNVAVQGFITTSDVSEENKKHEINPMKPKKFHSMGSGVIIDNKNGYVVTNAHVIRNATVITITLYDGRRLTAKLIGDDPATDLAVLQIKASHLPHINEGDSLKAKVGDFVIAVGNPFGLNSYGNSQSATFGIISALQRNTLNIEGIENFIQTDAAINPGNSGGALLNVQGELIGINTAILAPYGGNVGIGFAIPINMVKDVAAQLIKYGSVHRGLMGVFVQHLTPEIALAFGLSENIKGALITQVNSNSPAEKAGLKVGDIITKINNTSITDAAQVKTVISLLRVGSNVHLDIIRDKKPMTLLAVVSDLKEHQKKVEASDPFLYGLALKDFYEQSPMQGLIRGVQIVGASENSAGWRSGLRPGDVITHVNGKAIESIKDLNEMAKKFHDALLLRIIRGPGSLFIVLK